MMGRLTSGPGQLFYQFDLNDAVPEDHLVRKIDTALDLSWLGGELAPHYASMGRPSIDPELMIRMLKGVDATSGAVGDLFHLFSGN